MRGQSAQTPPTRATSVAPQPKSREPSAEAVSVASKPKSSRAQSSVSKSRSGAQARRTQSSTAPEARRSRGTGVAAKRAPKKVSRRPQSTPASRAARKQREAQAKEKRRAQKKPITQKIQGLIAEAQALIPLLKEKTHYELLELSEECSEQEIRLAFRQKARLFHVDRFKRFNIDDEILQNLQEVFIAYNRAHEILSHEERRAEYDAARSAGGDVKGVLKETRVEDVFLAEKLVREGITFIRNNRGDIAWERFKEALKITPDDHLAQAGEAYAEFFKVHSRGRSPQILVKARERLEEITAEFSSREEPFLYLGRVYRISEDLSAAESSFLKALELNPHCAEARSELRHIQRKLKGPKRSRFGLGPKR